MIVTILCRTDYAGSGHNLCDALSLEHDCKIYTGWNKRYLQPDIFGHRNQDNIVFLNRRRVQQRIDKSDVVLIKGDWPARDGYLGLKIMHKPTVQVASGSAFRKIEHGGRGNYHPAEYKSTINASFIPDLLYPEYGNTWIPHPIDSRGKPNVWKQSDIPVLVHIPSNRRIKNTLFVEQLFKKIESIIKVDCHIIDGLTLDQSIQQKISATIYFDQFGVGFYGNAAIEAMQYGVPVCNWISDMAIDQASGSLIDCPVISISNLDLDRWADKIIRVLDSDMSELSSKTKQRCDNVHSYEAVLKRCNEIFSRL